MLRTAPSRLREWIAVDDPEERIEGSGEAIVSPQHRRCRDAERTLEDLPDDARHGNR